MGKYKVAVSGWALVEVEADSAEQAEQLVRDEAPDIAGELYDMIIDEVIPG